MVYQLVPARGDPPPSRDHRCLLPASLAAQSELRRGNALFFRRAALPCGRQNPQCHRLAPLFRPGTWTDLLFLDERSVLAIRLEGVVSVEVLVLVVAAAVAMAVPTLLALFCGHFLPCPSRPCGRALLRPIDHVLYYYCIVIFAKSFFLLTSYIVMLVLIFREEM
jgi:hypothetical protein